MRVSHVMVVSLLMAAGCSADETTSANLAQRACERIDECNALPEGNSVDDCTQRGQKQLDDLAPAARADKQKVIEDCLAFQTCERFLDCLFEDEAPGTGPGGDDEPPGRFTLSWAAVFNAQNTTCATAGIDELRLTSTGPKGTFVDGWPCEDYAGTTQPLPPGPYSVVLSMFGAGSELSHTDPLMVTLAPGQTLDLSPQ
jgi:hypothetical protein